MFESSGITKFTLKPRNHHQHMNSKFLAKVCGASIETVEEVLIEEGWKKTSDYNFMKVESHESICVEIT